jgi:hypothetical protein
MYLRRYVGHVEPETYDPNDPDIVNFVDYEVLADNWLSEYLWPPE